MKLLYWGFFLHFFIYLDIFTAGKDAQIFY